MGYPRAPCGIPGGIPRIIYTFLELDGTRFILDISDEYANIGSGLFHGLLCVAVASLVFIRWYLQGGQ